jgi:hypothetical protein
VSDFKVTAYIIVVSGCLTGLTLETKLNSTKHTHTHTHTKKNFKQEKTHVWSPVIHQTEGSQNKSECKKLTLLN